MGKQDAAELRQNEIKSLTEQLIAPAMFTVLHESLARSGIEVRADMVKLTQRVFVAALQDRDQLLQQVAMMHATKEANRVLKAANVDQLPTLWVSAAHAVLKAAARGVGFHADLLLICTGIECEIETENSQREYGGMALIERSADRIDNAARLGGWWHVAPANVLAI